MEGLDLSGLSDDQLVELARACCLEAIQRSPAAGAAMRDMMLTEAEKARIAREATEVEIAAARARERERIAKEAAAKVRAEEAKRTAAAQAQAQSKAAQEAREKAELARHRDMALLRQAAELVGEPARSISLLHFATSQGRKVYINRGSYRYSREHIVSFDLKSAQIRTTAALVNRKPDLVNFCASLSAAVPVDTFIAGSEYPGLPGE